jgi:hypothetical protein
MKSHRIGADVDIGVMWARSDLVPAPVRGVGNRMMTKIEVDWPVPMVWASLS